LTKVNSSVGSTLILGDALSLGNNGDIVFKNGTTAVTRANGNLVWPPTVL